jgi:hypothetical protein
MFWSGKAHLINLPLERVSLLLQILVLLPLPLPASLLRQSVLLPSLCQLSLHSDCFQRRVTATISDAPPGCSNQAGCLTSRPLPGLRLVVGLQGLDGLLQLLPGVVLQAFTLHRAGPLAGRLFASVFLLGLERKNFCKPLKTYSRAGRHYQQN